MKFRAESVSGFGSPETRLIRDDADIVVEMIGPMQRAWAEQAAAVMHCRDNTETMPAWCRAMRIALPPMTDMSPEESQVAFDNVCQKFWDAGVQIEMIKKSVMA